jgi:hypothetical protein
MKSFVAFVLLTLLMSTVRSLAQPVVDIEDKVLLSYLLTPEQEASFSHTDGLLSPFWNTWVIANEKTNLDL